MRKFLRGAVVLLIAIAMFFSTVAIADTQTNKSTIELDTSHEGSGYGAIGDVVWDNGMEYDGLCSSQYDSEYPFESENADDFHFEEDTEVCDVHWIGGYWAGDPAEFDWCIRFYKDRGDGEAPGELMQEDCYTWDEIEKEDLGDQYYEMNVDLPHNKMFYACEKYWISIQGVGVYPPQSGWAFHYDPIILHQAVFKSEYFGFPDWTDWEEVNEEDPYPRDMCFQLTTKQECQPSIDVEKYVWDPKNQEWVDADDEATALDLPICEDATFKIVIHNNGDADLKDIKVSDKMHDSLKFISADPEPDDIWYEPPFYYMEWYFPGPLPPCSTIEIYITAHVEGPECSYDFNYVLVEAEGCGQPPVRDDDYAYVHAYKTSRDINTPLLNLLELLMNQFPILKALFGL